jgi:hypothetical protein
MGVSGQLHAPTALLPQEELGTHLIGGWVSTDDDVGGFGGKKNVFGPVRIRTPDRPARRIEKLLHFGHVQYTYLFPSVQKYFVSNGMASRPCLLRHFNYAAN